MNEICVVVARVEGEEAVLIPAHPTEDIAKRARSFAHSNGKFHMTEMEVEAVDFSN